MPLRKAGRSRSRSIAGERVECGRREDGKLEGVARLLRPPSCFGRHWDAKVSLAIYFIWENSVGERILLLWLTTIVRSRARTSARRGSLAHESHFACRSLRSA